MSSDDRTELQEEDVELHRFVTDEPEDDDRTRTRTQTDAADEVPDPESDELRQRT
jgi:hypothetical protein